LNAENNWWGTAVESEIQTKIYDWFVGSTKGIVDYTPWSTVIRTDTPISPPTGLTATAGTGTITLNWTANPESDLAGYKVYWDTKPGHPYENSVDVGNVTGYTIPGLDFGSYYVTVTAYDSGYNISNDDPNTIVNENQTNGNESWYALEQRIDIIPSCVYTLTVNVNPAGSGTVTKNPNKSTYCPGDQVTLTATPNAGYTFSSWSGDLSGSTNPATITMNGNKNVTANFSSSTPPPPPTSYTLTTSVNPPGAGTVIPSGGTYGAGTIVTLTATPNLGYTFSSWSGDLSGSTNPAQITMDGYKTVTAVFLLIKVEENNPAITYTGTWNTYTSASCSGGAMKYSGQQGAKAEFSFTGTGIKWIVTKAMMMGKAKVYLDGGYMGLVDLYSSSPAYQVVLQKAGLAPGNHTLRLEFSGQKNPRATGYYINIDAFEVIP
jgi:uncharacterized repeat protein (TIGR02543 family)